MTAKRKVLITGGAGRIANSFASATADEYDLTLLDLPGTFRDEHHRMGGTVEADIADLGSLAAAFAGVDTVVHLAGERRPGAAWSTLLPANIIGTYNVVAAALAAGCRRLVYASSVHAVSGYPAGRQVRESDPVRPSHLYGATKCWGEALGACAAAEGLSFVALRIGAFEDPSALGGPDAGWMVRDYAAPDDVIALLRTVIEAEGIDFEIYNAVSANLVGRLPMDKARRELGFSPTSDAIELTPALRDAFADVRIRDKHADSGFRDDIDAPRGQVPA